MTYVELCQRVVRLAGIGGASRGLPATVTGNPHRVQIVCDHVAEAVRDIESMYIDWTFLRRSIDFFVESECDTLDPRETHPDVQTVNEQAVYAREGTREQRIACIPWPRLREYREAADLSLTPTLPTGFAASPDGKMQFFPVSTKAFTVRAECVVVPASLTDDGDEPNIPASHRDVIVYSALARYYEGDEAWELLQATTARRDEWMARLEGSFLPGNAWSLTHSPEQPLVVRPH